MPVIFLHTFLSLCFSFIIAIFFFSIACKLYLSISGSPVCLSLSLSCGAVSCFNVLCVTGRTELYNPNCYSGL